MFIGHQAAAFAAKRVGPRINLGILMAATLWLDLLWPIFTLGGVEHFRVDPGNTAFTPLDLYDYPWSHSLLMAFVWSAAFAIVYRATRKPWRDALIVAAAVMSHWVLDFFTHRADLPLWPGGPEVGMGMWNSKLMTVAVEGLFFVVAVWLYLRATVARDRIGSVGLWVMIVFLAVTYIASFTTAPPPTWQAVAWVGMAAWIFVPWAWWVDRHRQARAPSGAHQR